MNHSCPDCGAENLKSPPDPSYHEDFILPGTTMVMHEFTTSPTIRIYNEGINQLLAVVPISQIRTGSVRHVGDKGSLVVSKWLAKRRGWT